MTAAGQRAEARTARRAALLRGEPGTSRPASAASSTRGGPDRFPAAVLLAADETT
jgi:hypothetical protein